MVSIRRRKHLLARIKLESTKCAENQEALVDFSNSQPYSQGGTPPTLKTDFRDKELKRRKLHRRKPVSNNQEPCTLRGVYFKNCKWQAAIKVGKKQVHLGTVNTQEEAAHLYDRAAYMCGREPNFVLSDDEKRELQAVEWEEFLAITRRAIAQKKMQNKLVAVQSKRRQAAMAAIAVTKVELPVPVSVTPTPASLSPPPGGPTLAVDPVTEAPRPTSTAQTRPPEEAPTTEEGPAPAFTTLISSAVPVPLPEVPPIASVGLGMVPAASTVEV